MKIPGYREHGSAEHQTAHRGWVGGMRGGAVRGSAFRASTMRHLNFTFGLGLGHKEGHMGMGTHPANLIPPLTTKHASALSVDGTPSLARCRDKERRPPR